jgi:hypothetical protein
MSGDADAMTGMFAELRDNPQILAVELRNHLGAVVDRHDRLVDTLPALDSLPLRAAVLEPRLLADLPPSSPRPAG